MWQTKKSIEYFPHESRGVPLDRMETCFSRFMDKVIERLDRTEPNTIWKSFGEKSYTKDGVTPSRFNVKLRPLWGMMQMNFLSGNSKI